MKIRHDKSDKFFKPLKYLKITLRLLGLFPIHVDPRTNEHIFKWRSCLAFHSASMALTLTVLVCTTIVGLMRFFKTAEAPEVMSAEAKIYLDERNAFHEVPLLVSAMNIGCLMNALVNLINFLCRGKRFAQFLMDWKTLSLTYDIDVTKGVAHSTLFRTGLFLVFSITLLIGGLTGKPEMLAFTLDYLAQLMLLVPLSKLLESSLFRRGVRLAMTVLVVLCYVGAKASLLVLVTSAGFADNALEEWRGQLQQMMDAEWTKTEVLAKDGNNKLVDSTELDGHIKVRPTTWRRWVRLLHGHASITALVRETDVIFFPTLSTYYFVTAVTLCAEFYLFAFRVTAVEGSGSGETVWLGMLTMQTVAVCCGASLVLCKVYSEGELCAALVSRGLPHWSDEKTHHYFELINSSVLPNDVAITVGGFFTVNRPFLVTVLSALVSYFIIIVQMNASPGSGLPTASNAFCGHCQQNSTVL